MKIAVPARQGLVDAHFGHCDHFMVYSLDEGRSVIGETRVDSPDGCGCKSGIAGVLARMGVTHLVAGNMGEGAVHVLQAHGIGVVRGASGDARRAAEAFAQGTLLDSGDACTGHGHHHDTVALEGLPGKG
jgi:predicted Fe-Mo cluster-binding NifX family protein